MQTIDKPYLLEQLQNLLNIPSPTGFTDQVIDYIAEELISHGLSPSRTEKGGLILAVGGKAKDRPRALTAHADTLGAYVKQVKPNGRLQLSKVGAYAWNTVEGEGCRIFTRSGKQFYGSLLPVKASFHIYADEVGKLERSDANVEVRIDEPTTSEEQTRALGIEVGDVVSFDPRTVVSENGFIRSRHLDDKASVACLLAVIKNILENKITIEQDTTWHFSNYEEIGHGAASGLPADLYDLLAVDMAVVGDGQNSDEYHTSICVKDYRGPYHYQFTRELQEIADNAGIPYKVDVYPFYGSDGEAYWRAGGGARVALVGPGVDSSHNYERTHIDALIGTSQLILAYLTS